MHRDVSIYELLRRYWPQSPGNEGDSEVGSFENLLNLSGHSFASSSYLSIPMFGKLPVLDKSLMENLTANDSMGWALCCLVDFLVSHQLIFGGNRVYHSG